MEPIKPKLDVQWTDVRLNGPRDDFWKHEWEKHGTCAIQLESLSTELKYFSKGTKMIAKLTKSTKVCPIRASKESYAVCWR